VTANLLPASIEVSAFNPQSLRELSDKLKTEPDIFDVQFPEDLVSPFIKWTTSIRIIGMSLVGTHIFITFCIILLIMSVKVVSKKDEIATFQFLGATKFYISLPFIVEGFIYGLVGGFLAWGIAYLVLLYSMGFWVSFLSGIPILPPPLWFMFSVLGGKLLLGGLIGSFGAAMATNRFLNR
jgi:cell division transport system permease protein